MKSHSTQFGKIKKEKQKDTIKSSGNEDLATSSMNDNTSNLKTNDTGWTYGTPPELTGVTYYTYNDVGDCIGSLAFNGNTIIEHGGHSYELTDISDIKYKVLRSGCYLFDYDVMLNGKKTHKTNELIISDGIWQFNGLMYYREKRTWALLTHPEYITDSERPNSDNEISENEKPDNEIDNSNQGENGELFSNN